MAAATDKARLLIVDDALDTLELLQRNLTAQGYEVFRAQSVAEAIDLLGRTPVDLVITDLKMPGASGLELVRHVREKLHDTEVMMITGYPSIEGAVEAVKIGAEDYVPKPFTQDELQVSVRRALKKLEQRRASSLAGGRVQSNLPYLVGRSEPMRRVFESVVLAAGTSSPVLITGEIGTGKEQVAREIHRLGGRARYPFVAVSCGKIPEDLLAVELLGGEEGGLFRLARGGTIFIDEIYEADLPLQKRLARVLKDGRPAGVAAAPGPQAIDVRLVAGTTRDLPALVNAGLFRGDLLLQLSGIAISVPPLRDRGDDIELLVQHFLQREARRMGRAAPLMAPAAIGALRSYPWPGNVAEMRATMERLVLASGRDRIELGDLPPLLRSSLVRADALGRSLAQVEADHIRDVLAGVEGNKTRGARALGIDRKTLREKMKAYDLEQGPADGQQRPPDDNA